jgi:amidase
MAIGSETYGSIISPSQQCGVIGLKPTAGSVNMSGIIPISTTLDIVGPIGTCINDIAITLGVMQVRDYSQVTKASNLRIGVYHTTELKPKQDYITEATTELLKKLQEQGATVVDVNTTQTAINDTFVFNIMRYEFKVAINKYLQTYPTDTNMPQMLQEIIDQNEQNKDQALKYGQTNLMEANKISNNWQIEAPYIDAIEARERAQITFENYFNNNEINVIVVANAHCGIAAALGYPSLTMPLGTHDGVPIGCCLVARKGREDILISVGMLIEEMDIS